MRKPRLTSLLLDLLIDLALIAAGVFVYVQFLVTPILPLSFEPAVAALVGGVDNLARLIAAVLILAGVWNLITLVRPIGRARRAKSSS